MFKVMGGVRSVSHEQGDGKGVSHAHGDEWGVRGRQSCRK